MQQRSMILKRLIIFALSAYVLMASSVEFWNITWGTGEWLGQFSFKWALAFFVFILFCIACLAGVVLVLSHREKVSPVLYRIAYLRDKLGAFRWILTLAILIAPVWFLQYTAWGLIARHPYLRLLIWVISAIVLGVILSRTKEQTISWLGLLTGLVLISGTMVFAVPLTNVTSYPFSLGWSEGNRLWDYSVLFGRNIYDYPADKPIPVLLDIGRQFIGGIPFLIPGVTIWQARLWVALGNVLPYLFLGWIAYKLPGGYRLYWILAGIWAFTFVEQGPIHPPLLWCAIFVAFAWRRPLWLAIPVILVTSYFAEVSRFTWLFAPGMWAGMLELSGAALQDGRLSKTAWVRAISVGIAGIIGGYLAPFFVPSLISWVVSQWGGSGTEIVSGLGSGVTLSGVGLESSAQPLLWYRLFPNATYGYGILIGLLLAVTPLIVVLIHLSITRRWVLNTWQKLAIILPLLAFLVVGLIVSVKIGGGGDLHNMDMFILGLMFAGAIAWRNSGREWMEQSASSPVWVRIALLLMVVIPAYHPYMFLRPNVIAEEDMPRVMTLADISPTGPMPELLPYDRVSAKALKEIRREIDLAAPNGEILFIDQRQLLTFGYITDIPLVVEYDKKVLINQAMSEDARYFEAFYRDLASQRFSLIISNPLHMRIQTDSDEFGEENNAWVKWVSTPLLCYYEPIEKFKKVDVQLLVPRQDISSCAQYLDRKSSQVPILLQHFSDHQF